MSDFASAAMVRVLAQGMRELGLAVPAALAPAGGARVALDLKRALVAEAWRQGGIGCLAQLGRGVHRHAHEPTHRALAAAHGAADLFVRWRRLERYIHSRHRTRVAALADGQARLEHVALTGAAAPLPAEDLVVLGVLAALLETLDLRGVQAWAGGVPVLPVPDVTALERAAQRGATARWRLRWEPGAGVRPPLPAPRASPDLPDLFAAEPWSPLARQVGARLVSTLMHPPPLPALAAQLGLPARSLQRRLATEGLGYAPLLAEARRRAAAWWLLHSDAPIAEVGFVCGYADQPHFTRDFGARVGLAPGAYRAEFRA